jgi:hypothetical protein
MREIIELTGNLELALLGVLEVAGLEAEGSWLTVRLYNGFRPELQAAEAALFIGPPTSGSASSRSSDMGCAGVETGRGSRWLT